MNSTTELIITILGGWFGLHHYIKRNIKNNYEVCKDELFGGYSNNDIISLGKVYEIEDFTISGELAKNLKSNKWQFLYNGSIIGYIEQNLELDNIINNSDVFIGAKCIINGGKFKYYNEKLNKVEIGKEPLTAEIKVFYRA